MDATMQAVRFHAYGGPEQLLLERVPRPEPRAGEILVSVHAAGVNPIDWKIRAGLMRASMSRPLPSTPGGDLAGTVAAVGGGVAAFQRGQAVYGRGNGSYAEYATAPAEWLAPMPRNLTFDQAAAVPAGARIAWVALFDLADLRPGQRVLIHGAAGGAGNYAVQLARWKGAHVIGTASGGNAAFVRSIGAETVIDYQAVPFERAVRGVDVVVDLIGGETQDRSWQALKPGGILVAIGHAPDEDSAERHGVRTVSTILGQRSPPQGAIDPLTAISALLESGIVTPQVGPVFTLEHAGRAQALSETGHGRGRIVLHVAD